MHVNEISIDIIKNEKPNKGLEIFVAEFYDDRMEELDQAIKLFNEDNLLEISKLAHKWKGYSAPYGFNMLGEMGAQLEISSKENNTENTKLLLDRITHYLELKKDFINN